jgi:hypothetical protein
MERIDNRCASGSGRCGSSPFKPPGSPPSPRPSTIWTTSSSTRPSSAAVSDRTTTVADVAGRIDAHEQTVRGWIKSGELKGHRFGTRIGDRIRLGDDEAFLSRRTLSGAIATQLLRSASAGPDS